VEAQLDAIEQNLATLDASLSQFVGMNPVVLVNPFTTKTTGLSSENLGVTDYYAPSVLVLLMQHLAITFAGLSIIGDRRLGIMELFQASPLSAFEVLVGKYISYLVFAGVLLIILTIGLVYGLGVPVRGRWLDLVLANSLLVFTSLGIGFVISLLAETTSQAVQYAMISLLASVFFTGFFMSLELMADWIQVISWLLPATYGIQWLQEIMLRGMAPDPTLLVTLGGFGVALFMVAWLLLRRLMARQ
jgi:ABC-2 type transport system permease protein